MRLARWRHRGEVGEGFVVDDHVLPLPDGGTIAGLLAAGLPATLEIGAALVAATHGDEEPRLDDVELLPPLVPTTIRDFVAFEEHVEGVSAAVDGRSEVVPEWYEYPTFYFTNPHSVVATGETVVPPQCERLDFELEVAAVIGAVAGSDGANLTPEQGAAAIFGFTILNDWSARDVQAREMRVRLGPAKGKDFASTLGPWIVTADELADVLDPDGFHRLAMEAEVNGTPVGNDLLSNMGWPFGELVAYASRNTRVVPGDVLGSGTGGNGCCLAELWGRSGELSPPPLVAGDEVVLRVERLGELRNVVGHAGPVPRVPRARPRRPGPPRATTEVDLA
ncbi:fumarylacetoacetate hydrolase family protein [Promicromonospora soli]|uniref:Hydroxylase n=1 Tax=Promicromonospora soli TaxID=2035533 RepID=A0A919FZT2_9MICO|nr:fumarylacetoacetate hydrolase family protein [Promicromonospora soli]GHH75473.1 hydroxylase [Promicromonospora soli]